MKTLGGFTMKKAFSLGLLAAFFFSFTFILNSQMNILGEAGYGAPLLDIYLCYLFYL